MDRNWYALKDVLTSFQQDEITVLDLAGNHGDRLIHIGLEHLLVDMKLSYSRYAPREWGGRSYRWKIQRRISETFDWFLLNALQVERPEVIYLQGGGNFNEFFDNGIELFRMVLDAYPHTPVIVGPQTIWIQDGQMQNIIHGAKQQIHLVCRELYSYAHLNRNLTLPDNVTIHLAPDTVLFLEPSDLKPYMKTTGLVEEFKDGYDLLSFRGDYMGIIAYDTLDDIRSSDRNVLEQEVSNHHTRTFEEFVSRTYHADRVFTDRMHGAILGHVLEKEVFTYKVLFFKNEAAYRYHFRETDSVKLRSPC